LRYCPQHEKAIENAIIAYSDFYIEVRDLGEQVDAQQRRSIRTPRRLNTRITALVPITRALRRKRCPLPAGRRF
jgi:hypothetical protein